MGKLYLTMVSDQMFTGSECYRLSHSSKSIDDIAQQTVLEYISLWGEIGKKEEFVRDNLRHYPDCTGCQNPQKIHDLGIEVDESQFEKYEIDQDYYDGEIPIDVKVLCLDEHPTLRDQCTNSPILKPGELLRSTDIDFRHKKLEQELRSIFYEHSE